jgi:hypothetical protein
VSPHQWVKQPVRMIHRLVGRRALGAEHAVVQRKVLTRLDADDLSVGDLEIHPTLHTTITAVRRDIAINRFVRLPVSRCHLARMKIEGFPLALAAPK